ncbi:hypothetical protein [Streptomyces profundus]|uniref:hypothetical protein n=1 Tax=Streptomyces profundus TaxID=2867410 RepID=UPI001D160A68|nr:hypothetical protein [Streptomyces sp. MA3_2.13]UED84850.1 hypothetical protein K4G22_12065 [Streptomyces sp. MA3_2.13]
MPWTVPQNLRLSMRHQLDMRQGPSVVRSQVRLTSVVVARPERGEVRVALACGHCGREGIFVIQDLDTTRQLRRRPITRSLIWAFVCAAVMVGFWVVGFAGGSILFQVLAIPATIVLAPLAFVLSVDPTSKIGVELPEPAFFDSRTAREGITYVTRDRRPGQGLSCVGAAEAAK